MIGLYLIIFRYKYPEAYSHVVRPFLNLWMLVFWIIALGLLASLAEHWQQPQCTYSFASGYECTSLPKKRPKIPHKRDTTTYTAYSAALIAGTVFSSFEVYAPHSHVQSPSNPSQHPLGHHYRHRLSRRVERP